MSTASSENNLYSLEVLVEPWVSSVLGCSASSLKVITIIWGFFGLLPTMLYLGAAKLDGAYTLEGDAIGLLEDPTLFAILVVQSVVLTGVAFLFPKFAEVL